MRFAITGATGMIGSALTKAVLARGDQAVVLTRDGDRARDALGSEVELHVWAEPTVTPPPQAALAGVDAVVHLLGEPVAQRWTDAARRKIRDSRVLGTRSLIATLAELSDADRPETLICQSATGYYGGGRGDERLSENEPAGDDFLAEVSAAWEHEALAAKALPGLRVVLTRTGVVLAPSGGALAKMLPPFRLGVGGPVAGGQQYVPWIHLEDVVAALLHCVDHDHAVGPVNLTAPSPVSNAELSRTLGRVLHRPALLPVPGAALRLLYGQMGSIVIEGQRAIPERLRELEYSFHHPDLEPALRDVLAAT